ncbi:hypothetical protein [Collimonas sp.]|jgi:hypothetical protein|uniref:hypothetical protein n=1 Tax=Collimonas sp. TaxID=1963772 RepID=UPI002BB3D8CB|nr:hypothetical protein [Collimonas sp.]HWW05044.1 hypothetical protein [Collimonas sp.]
MKPASRLLVAATLLATLSLSMTVSPAMAAAPARKTATQVQAEEIPQLPPIVIIGKRMTVEEKVAFAQQQHAQGMKKVARKKNEKTGMSALSAL